MIIFADMKSLPLILSLLLLTVFDTSLHAQDTLVWDDFINDYITDDDGEIAWTDTYETLTELHEHPLNINIATREELGILPFLTDKQIEDIQTYIYNYGEMKSAGELLMIESLDYETRCKLMFFIYIGDAQKRAFPKIKNIIKYGQNEILASLTIPCYDRKGDENGYLGYKYRHSLKYTFRYGNDIKAGFIGAQGSGEPFFADKNRLGYDYYGYYLIVNNLNRLKTIALGCYKLSFGMGLVVSSNFSLGKVAALSSLGRMSKGISAHASQSESDYFDGIATTIELSKYLSANVFASFRKFDATLNDDQTIATILNSGYHRTQGEMDKKNNCSRGDFGGHVNLTYRNAHLGATAIYTTLDRTIAPNTSAVYRTYYPAGRDFLNASIDYGYLCRFFVFNGETATGNCGGIATLNNFNFHLNKKVDFIAVQRFYSYRYSSLHANSFSEGGSIQNESGIYLGANWHPAYLWTIMTYTDWFYFAWPRYQTSQASRGCDQLLSIAYQGKRYGFEARYRLHVRQKDGTEENVLQDNTQQRGRMRFRLTGNAFDTITQLDFTSTTAAGNHEYGYMVSENIGFAVGKTFSARLTGGYFHTDSYNSRVYIYEGGLLYRFAFPSFYGEGTRMALTLKKTISSTVTLVYKLGITRYFDRHQISSGMQLIDHASQTDCDLQFRWRF